MTDPAKRIQIALTAAPPVSIDPTVWPVVARAEDHDGEVESQANRKYRLRVRQHADGRAIVYGWYDTNVQHESDLSAGEMLASGADVAAAILRVAAQCDCTDIAAHCIADLPAVEVD